MLLLEAQKYLDVVRKRGEARSELRRVYSNIARNKELYLLAYANLYGNAGALTPGVAPDDTVDGMSEARIATIMGKLRRREYRWKPVRRTYILKRDGIQKRPLGMPGWNDKVLQEVLRMVLTAYYEPQFRKSSHGFRPNRGCHTALADILTWKGTQWFIEGDITGCFDNLQHKKILEILRRKIKDTAFLNLIEGLLHVGYVEDWVYHKTYSGAPQGGIISPLFANIVLNELDVFVEDTLIPQYTKGTQRRANKENLRLRQKAYVLRKKGDYVEANRIFKVYSQIPSVDYDDPNFRRLRYARYADDTLLGLIGTKTDADTIKEELGTFLSELGLETSEEKTLITHAGNEKARFLNYEICIKRQSTRKAKVTVEGRRTRRRSLNGTVLLFVPKDVIKKWKARTMRHGKSLHRAELMNNSDFEIIRTYESQLQGLINYYLLAHNVAQEMWKLRYYYETSLVKTLASKFKKSVSQIRRKYRLRTVEGRRVIGTVIEREGKKPLRAVFGLKHIQRTRNVIIHDSIVNNYMNRSELIERLLAGCCELCGKEGDVVGHHIKKLKDLQKKTRKREKWEQKMIAMKRKTLMVCVECHQKIHNGTYDGKRLT